MSDIELMHLRDGRNRPDRVEIQPVTGMAFNAKRSRQFRRTSNPRQLSLAPFNVMAISTGMKLDNVRPDSRRCADFGLACLNKQGQSDSLELVELLVKLDQKS